eukprot:scaffold25.g5131.t1
MAAALAEHQRRLAELAQRARERAVAASRPPPGPAWVRGSTAAAAVVQGGESGVEVLLAPGAKHRRWDQRQAPAHEGGGSGGGPGAEAAHAPPGTAPPPPLPFPGSSSGALGLGAPPPPPRPPSAGGGAAALSSSNVGFKLLKKAGWEEGTGLGAKRQGIVEPVQAANLSKGSGLGFEDPFAAADAFAAAGLGGGGLGGVSGGAAMPVGPGAYAALAELEAAAPPADINPRQRKRWNEKRNKKVRRLKEAITAAEAAGRGPMAAGRGPPLGPPPPQPRVGPSPQHGRPPLPHGPPTDWHDWQPAQHPPAPVWEPPLPPPNFAAQQEVPPPLPPDAPPAAAQQWLWGPPPPPPKGPQWQWQPQEYAEAPPLPPDVPP